MLTKTKTKTSRIVAILLASFLVLSMFPIGMIMQVFAQGVQTFDVTLGSYSKDAQVSLTNAADPGDTMTKTATNGTATFENFIDDKNTYNILVTELIGYEDYSKKGIKFISGQNSHDVDVLVKIDKIIIKGVVKDENDKAYANADISYSAYSGKLTGTTTTNINGEYSFEAYKGKTYIINASTTDDKYDTTAATVTVNNPTYDYTCAEMSFAIKKFVINTTAGANGTITAMDTVNYGGSKEIKATANAGYRIDSFSVDGAEKAEAKGNQEYAVKLDNITSAHTISATFKRQTYKITFTVDKNGKINYDDGSAQEVAGGSVDIEKIFDESTDAANPTKITVTATPETNYRVSKVVVDGVDKVFSMNDETYTKEFPMTCDHTFVVEFKLNTYSVTINDGQNGSSSSDKSVVDYNGTATVLITPDDGYNIESVKVNGTLSTNYSINKDESSYTLELKDITSDTLIDIEYSKVPTVSKDGNVAINSNAAIKIDDTSKSVTTYIYANNGTAIFTTEKKGIRINGIRTGSAYNTPTYKTSKSMLVEKIEVYYGSKWHNVEIVKNIQIIIDKTPAVVIPDKETMNWSKEESVLIAGSVTDNLKNGSVDTKNPSSGLSHIVWSRDSALTPNEVIGATNNKVNIGTDGKYSFNSITGEQNSKYYIYAVDIAGNVSDEKTVQVRIDRKNPIITAFTYSTSEHKVIDTLINFLSFGTISSNKIFVMVTGSDEIITSGLEKITLYYSGEILETKDVSNVSKNTAIFELNEEQFKAGKDISATIKDFAGNVSVATKPTDVGVTSKASSDTVKIDSAKPSATITPANAVYTDDAENLWYNDNIDLNVVATDNNAGIKSVEVELNGTLLTSDIKGKDINADFSSLYKNEEKFVINTSQKAVDGENTLKVTVTNNAGVKSDVYTQKVYIDTTAPNIENFEINRVGGTPIDKVLNFLTFGVFFNEKVEVTVTSNDLNASSGLKTITLYADDSELETKNINGNKATFTIPVETITAGAGKKHFDCKLSAKATDNTTNTTVSAVEPTTVNSNIKNSRLMIETISPTLNVKLAQAAISKNASTATAGDWYASDVEFTVTAGDADSGLRNVTISINNKELENDNLYSSKVDEKEYKVNTKDADINSDGSYTIKVSITDNAGNVYDEYSHTIYKDIDNPYITGFDFEPTDYVEGDESASSVEVTDYGFYFKEDTKVVIYSKDNVPSAGIKNIAYYLVDKDTGKSAETALDVKADGTIEFTIKANFKGQIFAKATDNVDNTANDFVNPNSTIVENEKKHMEETHITFDKAVATYKTNDNTELYADNVDVTLTVTDTYSGIRNIEWSVVAPYDTKNNQNGNVTVNSDKSVTADSDENWQQSKTDVNLVTEMKKTITINNNSDNIIIKVKMKDRAGNTSEEQIELSIDKTKPVISVVYDNNTPDAAFNDYYKADRTATITVTERNFKAEDVECIIKNTDDVIPTLSAWKEHKNATNPDDTYYTATVLYHADGDYTFDISCSDLAKNAADVVAQHKFTMDQTIPTINVSYDNTNAKNGNYYSAERTATITINEHNFETSRIAVIGTATDNGTTTVFPVTSAWSTNGDVHVATINYIDDAKYSFDIAYSDMADNDAADYTVEEFFVDKTAPTLAISGVADKSANKGDVIPTITCSDTNYDVNGITVNMNGINNGASKVNGLYSDIDNGQTFTFVNFEKTKENDDIYTLTAKAIDFAGNETMQTITFSVNRFGSVYTFNDSLSSIKGKYVQNEIDVVLTETNVDSLKHDTIKLKMTKNGTASDLSEGKDFSVVESGGDGQWSQYNYTVNKALFSNDGRYTVTLYSEDAAGNINENIDETKKAEISFGVDKTAPVIVPADFESNKQYPVESKNVSVGIKDNLILDGVKIYLNNSEVEYKVDGEMYTFDIAESNSKQNVKFVAVDAAGNKVELPVENFLVSTNVFVRWFNNTPLFVGSLIGVAVLGLGATLLVVFGKKKKHTV